MPEVKVTDEDIEAARDLQLPLTPNERTALAWCLARHRLAAIEQCAKVAGNMYRRAGIGPDIASAIRALAQ